MGSRIKLRPPLEISNDDFLVFEPDKRRNLQSRELSASELRPETQSLLGRDCRIASESARRSQQYRIRHHLH